VNKIFVISYSGSNSEAVEQAVKAYSSWFHFSKDVFLISGTFTALEIRTQLESKILQGKDKLLVLEVTIKNAEGWLTDKEWEWLKTERAKP
jgi:hypothetical protein